MRVGAVIVLLATMVACGGGELFKQYEYEEDVYLSLDGSATVYVNGSLAALDALRGASFNLSPNARFDTAAVRAFFSTPVTHVGSVSSSRRDGRRFTHVRIDVSDVRRLGEAAPFAWSSYRFALENGRFAYQQTIGAASEKPIEGVGWTGAELVAFRLHLPSTVVAHNAGEENHRRGNILVWEQKLTDRLHGRPLVLSAQMETESILEHTLLLFGATFAAVGVSFGVVVWWLVRRGAKPART